MKILYFMYFMYTTFPIVLKIIVAFFCFKSHSYDRVCYRYNISINLIYNSVRDHYYDSFSFNQKTEI